MGGSFATPLPWSMDYVAIGFLFVWCGLGDANKRKSLELAWIFREKETKKKSLEEHPICLF